ncbi:MAG: DUF2339 domain-containing protein [Acidobacteriota bacterium]|nr:DUF2339 domain-containing protein [Acidobacteriota bacterium]
MQEEAGPRNPIDATLLIALFLLLLVALPALAVYASSRIRRLEIVKRASEIPPPGSTPPPIVPTLEARLSAFEQRLAALEAKAGVAPQPVAPAPIPPPIRRPPAVLLPEASLPAPASARGSDLEKIVAERWLNYLGIIAMLFATAFFIKYAFDSRWVGPRGRVAVGLLCGSLIVLWSDRLRRRGYGYFSEGIAGLGASVLYLSVWGGWHYYRMFPTGVALAGMIVVTAAMAAITIGRDSQRLAFLTLAGGFVTPLLLSTGRNHEIVLFTYTGVLAAAMLGLERLRQWRWLPPLTFLAAEAYFWTWYAASYRPEKLGLTLFFATGFFLLFAVLPHVESRRKGRLAGMEILVAVANLFCYLAALRELLWPDHRWLLTAAYLLLGAAHLAVEKSLPQPLSGETRSLRRLLVALSLICISLAIPARLDHAWLTMAWAIEGAVIVWLGARIVSWRLRAPGLLLLGVAAIRLLFLEIPAPHFLWNLRFFTFAVAVACFAISAKALVESTRDTPAHERNLAALLLVAVSGYSLLELSLEFWDLFGRIQVPGMEHWPAQQMALSVLWTIFAAALVIAGMARKSALLRWQALALFALVVGKVFLYDLSSLQRFYRILSFLVLGVLLLGVSFLYQRRAMGHKSGKETGAQP